MSGDEEPQGPPVRKRVRTGCLKCRQRRRKCDEARPKCGSCTEKGFECRYNLQLSFPKDKAFTLRPEEAPPAGTIRTYSTVKFVGDGSENGGSKQGGANKRRRLSAAQQPLTPQVAGRASNTPSRPPPEGPRSARTGLVTLRELDEETKLQHSASGSAASTDFGERDVSAIDGLLALSHRTPARPNASPPIRSVGVPAQTIEIATAVRSQLTGALDQTLPIQKLFSQPAPPTEDRERNARLMSYFRYNIAPHLDIYELEQPFGVQVCALARKSELLRNCILSLASNGQNFGILRREDSVSEGNHSKEALNDVEQYQARQAATLLDFYLDCVGADRPVRDDLPVAGMMLVSEEQQDNLSSSLSWASSILSLGRSLATARGIRVPSSIAGTADCQISMPHTARDRLKNSSRNLCWLYAKVLNLRYAPHTATETPSLRGGALVQAWQETWESLQWWYGHRPYELSPVLETCLQAGDAFPTLIFSTACGSFCSQMYHSALLLLLQCKPRTLRVGEHFPGSVSQLWNARHVCSVAMSNVSSEYWHPTLWAFFMHAARYVTHEGEQQRVSQHAQQVLLATKWDLQGDLDALQEYWIRRRG